MSPARRVRQRDSICGLTTARDAVPREPGIACPDRRKPRASCAGRARSGARVPECEPIANVLSGDAADARSSAVSADRSLSSRWHLRRSAAIRSITGTGRQTEIVWIRVTRFAPKSSPSAVMLQMLDCAEYTRGLARAGEWRDRPSGSVPSTRRGRCGAWSGERTSGRDHSFPPGMTRRSSVQQLVAGASRSRDSSRGGESRPSRRPREVTSLAIGRPLAVAGGVRRLGRSVADREPSGAIPARACR